jgi:dephospho-CoA kinase
MPQVPRIGALRVGLTGGIASGKSTVAQRFAALGVPIIDADQVYRELTAPGQPLLQQIIERFGGAVRQRLGGELRRADGSLDRGLLRRLVFEDPAERRALGELTHPAIRARMDALAEAAAAESHSTYQIHVVPLLVENHLQSRYQRVLVVDCPESLQLARLAARDALTQRDARALLAAQAPRAARLAVADDVIVNDGAPETLAAQVAALHVKYLDLAANRGAGDGGR